MQAEARGGELLIPSLRRFWLAAAAALIADLVSKTVIFHILGGGPPPDNIYTDEHVVWVLPGAFRLICHYNTGGAFGVMAGQVLVFLAATAVLAPVLVMTAYHTREPDAPLWSLGMILGGAAGNLYDRLFHTGVRDFLEIIDPKTGTNLWPVFNVADIAIVVGVMVYVIWSILDFFHKRRQAATAAAEAEPE